MIKECFNLNSSIYSFARLNFLQQIQKIYLLLSSERSIEPIIEHRFCSFHHRSMQKNFKLIMKIFFHLENHLKVFWSFRQKKFNVKTYLIHRTTSVEAFNIQTSLVYSSLQYSRRWTYLCSIVYRGLDVRDDDIESNQTDKIDEERWVNDLISFWMSFISSLTNPYLSLTYSSTLIVPFRLDIASTSISQTDVRV